MILPKPNPYIEIGVQQGQLVTEKQAAYGDMIRGAQATFRILYPEGIKPEQYDDALLVLRVVDKLGRITRGQKKAFGESPWRDIVGYGILGVEQDERERPADDLALRCGHCGKGMDTMHALVTHDCSELKAKIERDDYACPNRSGDCPAGCRAKADEPCPMDPLDERHT